jgi:CRP-like cAMP-binding protein
MAWFGYSRTNILDLRPCGSDAHGNRERPCAVSGPRMITVEQLRAAGQLADFSDEDLEMLLGATAVRAFAAGERLAQQGRPATSCFIVVSGVVEVVRQHGAREHVISHIGAGGIVGQLALVEHAPRSATLRAKTAVTALELQRDVFDLLLSTSSPLAHRFQLELAIATGRQLREANRRLAALLPANDAQPAREGLGRFDGPYTPVDIIEITPPERARSAFG